MDNIEKRDDKIKEAKKVLEGKDSDKYFLLSRRVPSIEYTYDKNNFEEPKTKIHPILKELGHETDTIDTTQRLLMKNNLDMNDLIEDSIQNPSTAGWNNVMQIKNDFMDRLIEQIFIYSFAGSLFTGELIPPEYEVSAWLLVYFNLKFRIRGNPTIEPLQVGSSPFAKIVIRARCEIRIRNNEDEPWSERYIVFCTVTRLTRIEPRANGEFLGNSMEKYYALDFLQYPKLNVLLENKIDPVTDGMFELWIAGAFGQYFKEHLPEFPITPENKNIRPFMFFDSSACTIFTQPLFSTI